ncbi:hypothetical protein ACS0TY_001585 [Phlomoides rotata]
MVKICTLSFLCLLIICSSFVPHLASDTPIPVFILGDSTADVGTNNYLAQSHATANFPQYGIDFPHQRPTGRFSNGFNSADALAKRFGLNRSPQPFLFLLTLSSHHFHKHLFKGVNFASGGAGLLDETGLNLTVVPLSEQITQFSSVRDNFTAKIGEPATEAMLNKSLFFISIGSNDIFSYFNTSNSMPKDQFISMLISTYSDYISMLYGLGARRFGIINVPPVGCCPYSRLIQIQLNGTNDCFSPMNDFALSFHIALDMLLRNISSQLPGIKYSLGNTYQMTLDAISNPKRFSFGVVDSACCGYGTLKAQDPCNSSAPVCSRPDRKTYLFWDKFHPTQEASEKAAEALYAGLYTSPISFSQLAQDN